MAIVWAGKCSSHPLGRGSALPSHRLTDEPAVLLSAGRRSSCCAMRRPGVNRGRSGGGNPRSARRWSVAWDTWRLRGCSAGELVACRSTTSDSGSPGRSCGFGYSG